MTLSVPQKTPINVRPLQYRDLEAVKALANQCVGQEASERLATVDRDIMQASSWYGLRKFLRILPYSHKKDRRIYVAEGEQQILGLIQVSPFNSTGSTWRVERVLIDETLPQLETAASQKAIGSQLLRYCLENIWEARTWILEVNINDKNHLALYRESGFQPLAQMTYWRLKWEAIKELAQQNPDLPNLLPVSNADAGLLYQLDCASMPPLLRQIFDRHIPDFKSNIFERTISKIRQWLGRTEVVQGYIFEPQRKAAIGYFQLVSCSKSSRPHQAKLTVNPAYTWLYHELLVQMAQIAHKYADTNAINQGTSPLPSLEFVSADYQSEREEYLNKIGAFPVENTLLMSRSVWHKIRETKPLEGLQLSDVLQGLKPAQTPIPSRISWLKLMSDNYSKHPNHDIFTAKPSESTSKVEERSPKSPKPPNNGHRA
ncbi:conserved hypothetical protein [Hyella patelloides LEGE 07179]|uniref:N-acetyltransferase domain-containing protein n=1 Tax=Hyella patelloides LEGE 07179 TaxID=945734 RepID=A0A563W3Q6_9CYAN|nr:GNAT family N-acetyltransferase [Hyella patelloides]VEP18329.1 conserved hypothetical protein [Hyella patelloides LEGE 07179]